MPRANVRILTAVVILCLLCAAVVSRPMRTLKFVMDLVRNEALEEVDEQRLFEGAMHGVMSELDEHSAYIPPARQAEFNESIDREFGGLGVEVREDRENHRLLVLAPIHGSPAQRAGLRAGDVILRVDGVTTKGMSLEHATKLMRGPEDEPVTVTVRHLEDDQPVDVDILRERILVPSVIGERRLPDGSYEFQLREDPRIAYCWVESFTDRTADELLDTIEEQRGRGVKALILDFRDNPGGILEDAIQICDFFLDEGVIVTTRDRDGEVCSAYFASREGTLPPMPIAVLIDDQSASAAEIVTACLQDHGRAVVIGERSYGKGTVQDLIHLQPDQGIVKLTTAGYWRPSGRNIHRGRYDDLSDEWGVSPNEGFEYDLSDADRRRLIRDRYYRTSLPLDVPFDPPLPEQREDADLIEDVELERAIEFLQEQLDGTGEVQARNTSE